MESDSCGKYDAQVEQLLNELEAEMVLLMVVGGNKGHGMSGCINANNPNAKEMANATPRLLRKMADMIEKTGSFHAVPFPKKGSQTWSDLAKGGDEDDSD